MQRRLFIGGALALGASPAIVKAESLMRIVVPRREIVFATGGIWKPAGSDHFIRASVAARNEAFDAWVAMQLRKLAEGLAISYEQLALQHLNSPAHRPGQPVCSFNSAISCKKET